jgi:polyhydroxybutyrate depolymerase
MFMKPTLKMSHFEKRSAVKIYQLLAIVIAAVIFSSCRKEKLSDPVLNSTTSAAFATANTQLQVDAGPIKRVVYPLSTSTTLFGSGSDSSRLVTFKWTQIGGNSIATIAQPTRDITSVSGLKPGIYTFTLTVTDKSGTSRTDTTFVTVLKKMTWTIGGTTREALVHIATGPGKAPVIFAFHGHGGTDLGFAGKGFELEWPEAVVVYPQGLPTKSHQDPDGKKSGWQNSVGEVNSFTGIKDQDLKFFDAMLPTFKKSYNADSSRIFIHGWSNGGLFVYNVLWTARGDKLAALAPAAAILRTINGKKTVPVMHTAGTSDPIVSFSNQEKSVQTVRNLDQCSTTGTMWATGENGLLGTHYLSSITNPVIFLQYDGGHAYPDAVPPLIVKFFKQTTSNTLH